MWASWWLLPRAETPGCATLPHGLRWGSDLIEVGSHRGWWFTSDPADPIQPLVACMFAKTSQPQTRHSTTAANASSGLLWCKGAQGTGEKMSTWITLDGLRCFSKLGVPKLEFTISSPRVPCWGRLRHPESLVPLDDAAPIWLVLYWPSTTKAKKSRNPSRNSLKAIKSGRNLVPGWWFHHCAEYTIFWTSMGQDSRRWNVILATCHTLTPIWP